MKKYMGRVLRRSVDLTTILLGVLLVWLTFMGPPAEDSDQTTSFAANFASAVWSIGDIQNALAKFLIFLPLDTAFAVTFSGLLYALLRRGGMLLIVFPIVVVVLIYQSAFLADILWFGGSIGPDDAVSVVLLMLCTVMLTCFALSLDWKHDDSSAKVTGIVTPVCTICYVSLASAVTYFSSIANYPIDWVGTSFLLFVAVGFISKFGSVAPEVDRDKEGG